MTNAATEAALSAIKTRRNENAFVASIPFTPKNLLNKMLNKIDVNTNASVLVMFTVESIPVLQDLGYTNITATTDKYCQKTKQICDVFGVDYTIMDDINMKFDVCLTNPPYTQISNGANIPIYQNFYNKAVEIADTVAIVAPKNLIYGISKGHVRRMKVEQIRPSYVSFNKIEEYFKGYSTDACYAIFTKDAKITILETEDGTKEVDVLSETFQFAEDLKILKFFEKYSKGNKFTVTRSGVDASTFVETDDGKYKVFTKFSKGEMQNVRKANVSKKFRINPLDTPKFMMPKMTSGKIEELFMDPMGEYTHDDNYVYNCILDKDTDIQVVMNNIKVILPEFKEAFANYNFKGFVWNGFFNFVDKDSLTK